MLRTEQLLANKALLEDKAYGVLAGLAVGDSFGDASRKPDNQLAYGMTTDFNSAAAWSTDDTEFALLTATILAESGGRFSTEDVVQGWMEKVVVQEEFPRGGASEIEAARNLRRGLRPPQTGIYNAYSHSDGAAGAAENRGRGLPQARSSGSVSPVLRPGLRAGHRGGGGRAPGP